MNKFLYTPNSISYSILRDRKWILSPSIYKKLNIHNTNVIPVRQFLYEELVNSHLGNEVGSFNYIQKSTHFFLKTKALQDYSFLPVFTDDSLTPIFPQAFFDMHLSDGDILISKDSNIGEAIILDKDYPNVCLSGAIYKLPVKEDLKYYLLAFLKHGIFREQLDYIVPKGATIRHAKQLFLDCLIPLPNSNSENTIRYVSLLTKALINKEKTIKSKHQQIIDKFDFEISHNQISKEFIYELPRLSDIIKIGRFDCSHYTLDFKKFQHSIENYTHGHYTFSSDGYTCKRGQNLQISNIGQSVYSDDYHNGFYRLILSKHISSYSTINDFQYLGNPNKLSTLKCGEIIFSGRGEIGRVYILPYDISNTITNIDSLVFSSEDKSLEHSIYNAMYLNYLRSKNIIHRYGITGSGAPSFTKYQADDILIPDFPSDIQNEIAQIYHNKLEVNQEITLDNFLSIDDWFNENSGIFEVNLSILHLKRHLNDVLTKIAMDKPTDLTFDFYNHSDF